MALAVRLLTSLSVNSGQDLEERGIASREADLHERKVEVLGHGTPVVKS